MNTASPILQASALPSQPLYGSEDGVGWQLSPTPFFISSAELEDLHRLGKVLWQFQKAIDTLYKDSTKGSQPSWIAGLFNQGKPEHLTHYAQMNRFKSALPRVIRPDLLLTDNGWALCEIDAVPGGIGFTSALNQAYRQSGFSVVEAEPSMPQLFLKLLQSLVPDKPEPSLAIVLSDEAQDYRAEMQWLVTTLQKDYPCIYLVHPRQLNLVRDQLVFTDDAGTEKPIDLIYRFFELFDLPNIPKMDLIQYAVKKGLVQCTPPFKPQLEEKLSLALIHHPSLKSYWTKALGETDFTWLQSLVPRGWILDPAHLPPQAVIPDLEIAGQGIQQFNALSQASQKERTLVIKPSGFSPLGWGSRGVTVGHDVSQETWQEKLQQALDSFQQTPYILQRFHKPVIQQLEAFDLHTGERSSFSARTRLCPYYFVLQDEPILAGVLTTSCPANKKVIHGMKDAILAPVSPF